LKVIGKIGPGQLSKVAGAALPAFQKRIGNSKKTFGEFQNRRVGSACFQKLLAQLHKIGYPIGAKDFNSPVLKAFRKFSFFTLSG
jgi:hypothetical protein